MVVAEALRNLTRREEGRRCQTRGGLSDHTVVPSDSLQAAFDRLDAFVAVQRAQGGITLESVELLQRAVGIDDPERAVIRERVASLAQDASAGAVLLGVLVGLFCAEEQTA